MTRLARLLPIMRLAFHPVHTLPYRGYPTLPTAIPKSPPMLTFSEGVDSRPTNKALPFLGLSNTSVE